MQNKHYTYVLAIALLSLSGCTKTYEDVSVISQTSELSIAAVFKKIKTIEVKDSGVLKDQYWFSYKNDLLDSIIQKKNLVDELYYTSIYYGKKTTLPSGYRIQQGNGPFPRITSAGFIMDGKFIIQKVISNSTWYYYSYNDQNLIYNRIFGYPGYETSEIKLSVFYNHQNVQDATLIGDYFHDLHAGNYDDHPNPFHMQKNILYYLSFNPFNTFKNQASEGYNLYDQLLLSARNPQRLQYGTESGPYLGHKLVYSYDALGYPTKIIIYTADLTSLHPHAYNRTEVVDITYY